MSLLASNSPIVRDIVFRVISAGELDNEREQHRIDLDVVPTFSTESILKESGFTESAVVRGEDKNTENILSGSKIEISRKSALQGKATDQSFSKLEQVPVFGKFGRLENLITDPRISTIEYSGDRIPIRVTMNNRVQNTRIFLSKEEVKSIMEYVSKRAKIPIENKIFKVTIDDLLFSALISDIVGISFMIRKNFQISHDFQEALEQ